MQSINMSWGDEKNSDEILNGLRKKDYMQNFIHFIDTKVFE